MKSWALRVFGCLAMLSSSAAHAKSAPLAYGSLPHPTYGRLIMTPARQNYSPMLFVPRPAYVSLYAPRPTFYAGPVYQAYPPQGPGYYQPAQSYQPAPVQPYQPAPNYVRPAARPYERDGLFFAIGAGAGVMRYDGGSVLGAAETAVAPTLNLRVAGAVSQELLLGVALGGSMYSDDDGWTIDSRSLMHFSAEATLFPFGHHDNLAGGLFVRGGAGYGGLSRTLREYSDGPDLAGSVHIHGGSAHVGGGWDFFQGRGVNLGIAVDRQYFFLPQGVTAAAAVATLQLSWNAYNPSMM